MEKFVTAADLLKMTVAAKTELFLACLSTSLSDNISEFYFIDSLFTVVDCDANLCHFVVSRLSVKTKKPRMASG